MDRMDMLALLCTILGTILDTHIMQLTVNDNVIIVSNEISLLWTGNVILLIGRSTPYSLLAATHSLRCLSPVKIAVRLSDLSNET